MNAIKQNLFKAIDFLVRVESGPDAGKAYRLQPPKIILGRDPRCQIVLTDPKVSRQQLAIKFSNNVICEDLSSRKTTLINGKPCGKTILRPGDKISFGDTTLHFQTRTSDKAQAQLGGAVPTTPDDIEKKRGQKNLRMFLIGLVVLVGLVFLLEQPNEAPPEEKLATSSDLQKQIEETKERMALLKENESGSRSLNNTEQLHSAEKHFIVGFRDFQNGRYEGASRSFGSTIAIDPGHTRAQLYRKTANKKRADLIDTHLRDGQKYKTKLMYNRCAAEFEKALVLINDVNSKKYELAQTQLKECRILKSGGYR